MAKLREYGLVQNKTHVPQIIGPYRVEPGSIGRLPIQIVESMRQAPTPGLIVIDEHPDLILFFRTEVQPFSPRYQR